MCWSASADLAVGGIVALVGVAALAGVRHPRQLLLAALPLLLGVHQLIEAAVWWGWEGHLGPTASGVARTLWVLIAYPLLPALVPLAVLLVVEPARRRVVLVFLLVGLAVSGWLAVSMLSGPITSAAAGHAMHYSVGVPHAFAVGTAYLFATCGSLVASGSPGLRLLGAVSAVGAVLCLVVWVGAFVSTWCALAAVCSVLVLRWLRSPAVRAGDVVQGSGGGGRLRP